MPNGLLIGNLCLLGNCDKNEALVIMNLYSIVRKVELHITDQKYVLKNQTLEKTSQQHGDLHGKDIKCADETHTWTQRYQRQIHNTGRIDK